MPYVTFFKLQLVLRMLDFFSWLSGVTLRLKDVFYGEDNNTTKKPRRGLGRAE